MTLKKLALATTAGLFVAGSALAHPLGAGQWGAKSSDGVFSAIFCLVNDGTWYAQNDQTENGTWVAQTVTGLETGALVGNFNSGAGNMSIVIKKASMTLNEWYDDGSHYYFEGGTWQYMGATC